MSAKYTGAFSLLVLLASAAFGAADLFLEIPTGTLTSVLVEPGSHVSYTYRAVNLGPDAAEARLIHPIPPGAHFVSISDARWTCREAGEAVICTRTINPSDYYGGDPAFSITIAAPDDRQGLRFSTVPRVESDQPDPNPANNTTGLGIHMDVYHLLEVTTTEDFGAGSLRSAIEQANDECDRSVPCKIRFTEAMRIVPKSALPVITGCDLLIDGGGYDGTTRNRSFDVTRRIEIDGSEVESGSGLRVAAVCPHRGDGPTLRGLAIHSFPRHGIELDGGESVVRIQGCSLGTDPAGETALPNRLRGIHVVAPKSDVLIIDCLAAGNTRSGIGIENVDAAFLVGNLIGVRFGGIPLPNGASGVYVNDGFMVRMTLNAIEYNHEFGAAVGPNVKFFSSDRDFIFANGGIGVDWGLDGPTPRDFSGRMPPVPRLTDASAVGDRTVVNGILPIPRSAHDLHTIRIFLGAVGDFDGGLQFRTQILTWRDFGDEAHFTVTLFGNYQGQRITATSARKPTLDGLMLTSSEFSASIVVR